MNFAVCRVKKLKASNLAAVGNHNMRISNVPQRDPDGQYERIFGDKNKTTKDLVEEIIDKEIDTEITTIRKDAVVAVELVLSASPEYFRPGKAEEWGQYEIDKVESWRDATIEFIKEKYGENRLADVCLHLDEATPHMHVVLVPLDKKNIKKRRTKQQIKNNEENEVKECTTLNARDMFDRTALTQLQTDYADALKSLNIKRGVKKSRAKNKPLKKFYTEMRAPIQRLKFNVPNIKKPPLFNSNKWLEETNREVNKSFKEQSAQLEELRRIASKYKQRYLNEKAKTQYIVENFDTVKEIKETFRALTTEIQSLEHLNEQQANEFKTEIKELKNALESSVDESRNKDKAFEEFKKRYFKLKNEVEAKRDNDNSFSL